MLISLVILSVTTVVMSILLWVAYKKIKAITNMLVVVINSIEYVNAQLRVVDIRGSFEADDEVGFVFKEIQELVNFLHRMVVDEEEGVYIDGITEEEEEEEEIDR